jgi:hypothetical protein
MLPENENFDSLAPIAVASFFLHPSGYSILMGVKKRYNGERDDVGKNTFCFCS